MNMRSPKKMKPKFRNPFALHALQRKDGGAHPSKRPEKGPRVEDWDDEQGKVRVGDFKQTRVSR